MFWFSVWLFWPQLQQHPQAQKHGWFTGVFLPQLQQHQQSLDFRTWQVDIAVSAMQTHTKFDNHTTNTLCISWYHQLSTTLTWGRWKPPQWWGWPGTRSLISGGRSGWCFPCKPVGFLKQQTKSYIGQLWQTQIILSCLSHAEICNLTPVYT